MGHNVNPKGKTNQGKPRILPPHQTSQFETPAHASRSSPKQDLPMRMLATDTNPVVSLTLLKLSQEAKTQSMPFCINLSGWREIQEKGLPQSQRTVVFDGKVVVFSFRISGRNSTLCLWVRDFPKDNTDLYVRLVEPWRPGIERFKERSGLSKEAGI